jgi:hypothetical protein
MVENIKTPKLLIDDYNKNKYNSDDFIKKILNNEYYSIDDKIPICRFRGNLINKINDEEVEIISWQRNVSRIRRMDVSLPTIIKIKLDINEKIVEVNLDGSFKGSKGLFCSPKYLNKILKNNFKDLKIDKDFLKKIKISNTHCFHITEILGGLYTYYNFIKNDLYIRDNKEKVFFDEEIIDSYIEKDNLIASGIQIIKGKQKLNYALLMEDIFNKIKFQKNGYLRITEDINTKFYLDGKLIFKDIITKSNKDYSYIGLTRILSKCLKNIKDYFGYDKQIKILNSNIFPASFIGLLVQAILIRLYKNSYDYTMHMITSVQRPNDIPLCIGAINDEEDGMKYFPDFNIFDLI